MLLSLSSVDFAVLEEAVDLAGDVAFEAALGFSGGFAFGGSRAWCQLPIWVCQRPRRRSSGGQSASRKSATSPPR